MERREYFRIEQRLGIYYQPIPGMGITDPYDERLALPKTLLLVNQVRELEYESSLTLKKIQARQADTARFLKNLNLRVSLLGLAISSLDKNYPGLEWKSAALSETGIGFKTIYPLSPQAILHLVLAIPDPMNPSPNACQWVSMIANVTTCDAIPDENNLGPQQASIAATKNQNDDATPEYHLGLSFDYVSEFDKQYFARHILRVQSIRRRIELESRDDE